jgi:hypothetical protein
MTNDDKERRMLILSFHDWAIAHQYVRGIGDEPFPEWESLLPVVDDEDEAIKKIVDVALKTIDESTLLQRKNASLTQEIGDLLHQVAHFKFIAEHNMRLTEEACGESSRFEVRIKVLEAENPKLTHSEIEAIDWACSEMEYAMDGERLKGSRKIRAWLKSKAMPQTREVSDK